MNIENISELKQEERYWRYACPAILDTVPLFGHVRIEASAGTGKTYTLEHLVIDRLIRSRAELGEILVMTFTEKATAELKQRIRKLLTEVILKAEPTDEAPTTASAALIKTDDASCMWHFDETIKRKLELTLFGFDEAPIFTIHGFCSRILREQAFHLGEPLLQERIDTKTLFREIWRDFLSSSAAQSKSTHSVLKRWLENKAESTLFELLYDAYNGKYVQQQYDLVEASQRSMSVLRDASSFDALESVLDNAAITSAARIGLKTEAKSLINVLNESPQEEIHARLEEIDWRALVAPRGTRVAATKFKFPSGLKGKGATWHAAARHLYTMREALNSQEHEVLEEILPQLSFRMTERKRKEFLFDYDDLLHRLHHVLVKDRPPELLESLRAQFRFALIDEFQDTDETQWQIIEEIFLSHDNAQLILIGDPKQSIYGFRGAEIETYLRAGQRLESLVGVPPTDVYLETNYRSSSSLIDGLNLILSQAESAPLFSGRTQYQTPVLCGKPELTLKDASGQEVPGVSLLPSRPPSSGSKLAAGVLMAHYAQRVAQEIIHLLSDSVVRIHETNADVGRRIEPSDILVLVRKNSEAKEIESVFRKATLPVAQAPSGSVFKSDEAQSVIDLLKAISSPAQTAAWTRTLSGPFFGFSYNEISELDKKRPPPLQVRLEQWRELVMRGRLEQVLFEAYDLTHLELRSAMFDTDDQTLLNLRAVINYSAVETQKRRLRLDQLIQWLEDIIAGIEPAPDPFSDAPPAPENSNSIRIMTMHASKGLEAPIVFLCGGFSLLRKPLIVRSSAMGEKNVFLSAHLPEQVVQDSQLMEREEDEKLLYVGLTRAALKLYLPLIHSDSSIKGMYELLNQRLKDMLASQQLDTPSFLMEPIHRTDTGTWAQATSTVSLPDETTILHALDRELIDWSDAQTPITSYSKLKKQSQHSDDAAAVQQFLDSAQTNAVHLDPEITATAQGFSESEVSEMLIGGKYMGQALHDCLEHIDGKQWSTSDKMTFIDARDNLQIAHAAIEKHQLSPDAARSILELIWNVLNTHMTLTPTLTLPPIGSLDMLKEMEFLYPAPSKSTQTPGYIRGFIDGLFEHEGKFYWLDWKSDRLEDYSQAALERHVNLHYGIQAQLYTLALEKLLRIANQTEYESKMGGLIYVYLRGIMPTAVPTEHGFFFSKPSYAETRTFEAEWSQRGLFDPPMMAHLLTANGRQS